MDIVLSEINQTEKDKFCIIPLIYGIKKKINVRETEQTDWAVVGVKVIKSYKLPVLR